MTMTIIEAVRGVTGDVDTHLDVHAAAAAALDPLGTERFDTDPAGYNGKASDGIGHRDSDFVGRVAMR
jgi:hypothetical protein